MFGNQLQSIEINGRQLPVAGIVRRGGALAVDLCISILGGMSSMWLLSRITPLDGRDAQAAIVTILIVVGFYLLIGRDRFIPSVGRIVFSLHLVRPGSAATSGVAHRLARPLIVYDVADARDEFTRTIVGIGVVTISSLLAMFVFAHALRTTHVFQAVSAYVERVQPFVDEHGTAPQLDELPSSVLIGKHKSYVLVQTQWGEQKGALEFFLDKARSRDPWIVSSVQKTEPRFLGNYGLKTPDAKVPTPMTSPEPSAGGGKKPAAL
jgi:hypothetical protein